MFRPMDMHSRLRKVRYAPCVVGIEVSHDNVANVPRRKPQAFDLTDCAFGFRQLGTRHSGIHTPEFTTSSTHIGKTETRVYQHEPRIRFDQ